MVKCKAISGLCGDYAVALTIVRWRVDFMRHVSEASGLLSTLNGLNESGCLNAGGSPIPDPPEVISAR